MSRISQSYSRREFLALGAGALAASISLPVFGNLAKENLPLRQGQNPLLLHFNENSLGMSPQAQSAAIQSIRLAGNRYADEPVSRLKSKLANLHAVAEKQIVLSNGSTQVIAATVAQMAKKSGKLIEPKPTYGDASHYARVLGMETVSVNVGNGFVTDIEALRKATEKQTGPVLVNICNPNNPTGTIVDTQALTRWINEAPGNVTFLIDEAYHEYAQANVNYRSCLSLVQQGAENVIVARTFSKIYGMAGMRVGYAIAGKESGKALSTFAADFNLNVAGVEAAIAALDDEKFYQNSVLSNAKGKQILTSTLDTLGLEYVPSNTNFVLHQISGPLADYQRRMLANGIKVGRKMTVEDNWNRVSIGTPDEMEQFALTLKAFRQQHWI